MSKRHLVVIYLLLAVIVCMQLYIIKQNDQIKRDIVNSGNYISEKLDILTSKVNTYLID
ncbi:hypothetical protein SDC9_154165 [bioreactor metagenome]|uniref:Uncharacterized protein n=1 Tax=bioreactor metagenome TaxID=1076179 RepID=A0A645EXY3_9ZZZZ